MVNLNATLVTLIQMYIDRFITEKKKYKEEMSKREMSKNFNFIKMCHWRPFMHQATEYITINYKRNITMVVS